MKDMEQSSQEPELGWTESRAECWAGTLGWGWGAALVSCWFQHTAPCPTVFLILELRLSQQAQLSLHGTGWAKFVTCTVSSINFHLTCPSTWLRLFSEVACLACSEVLTPHYKWGQKSRSCIADRCWELLESESKWNVRTPWPLYFLIDVELCTFAKMCQKSQDRMQDKILPASKRWKN